MGVSLKGVKEYFIILEDTLIGFYLHPYYGSHRKRIINHPKFCLNDKQFYRIEISVSCLQLLMKYTCYNVIIKTEGKNYEQV